MWMKGWRDALLASEVEVEVPLEAFRAGRKARNVPDVAAAVTDVITGELPSVKARIGRKMTGEGLDSAFRLDFWRDAKHVRSYAIAWRKEKGTFVALKCAKDADHPNDGVGWAVEIQLQPDERTGSRAVEYRALYRLLKAGHALRPDEVQSVRSVNRSLHDLGLPLTAAESDPRRRPLLFSPGATPTAWLQGVARTIVARQMLAGLLESEQWAMDARTLLGWDANAFAAFAYAYGWVGVTSQREAVLERDLARRFAKHAERAIPMATVEVEVTSLCTHVDGQRPDVAVHHPDGCVVVEVKLGLTRDSVRTGLAQAAEYGYHLAAAGRPAPVVLLLGEAPEYHGAAFAAYVRTMARQLRVTVASEHWGTEFRVSAPVANAAGEPNYHLVDSLLA